MLDRDPDKQLDDLLESFLSRYSAAEPRAGLEKRILANLRRAQEPTFRFWTQPWFLGTAVATALAVLAAVALSLRPGHHSHPAPVQARTPVAHPEKQGAAFSPPVRPVRPATRVAKSGVRIGNQGEETRALLVGNRPPMFPTPGPLSEQEGFMFLYLANTPKEELVAQAHRAEERDDGFWDDGSLPSTQQQSGHIR